METSDDANTHLPGWRKIFAVDYRSLAAFRICFATILLIDLYFRLNGFEFFYSDDGSWPRTLAMNYEGKWVWSLHFFNGTVEFQALLFFITAFAALGLLLGWRTRAMSFITWLLIVSLHRRNPTVLQGGDVLIRSLSFWAMFLPLGAKWSIDARREANPPEKAQVCSVATMCALLQVAIVYIFAFWWKTGDPWVKNYDAVYFALSVEQFVRPVGTLLLEYPTVMACLTVATLVLEGIGPLFAFVPIRTDGFRLLTVTSFVLFHAGLLWAMELGPFPYVSICGWLLFIPSSFWDEFTGPFRPGVSREEPQRRSRMFFAVQSFALVFFFGNVLLWNLRSLDFEKNKKFYPYEYNYILQLVGLDQSWGMFSPYPVNWGGWFQISGLTREGRRINLTPGAAPDDAVTDDRPFLISRMYATERWRKYLMALVEERFTYWRLTCAHALMHRWNTRNPRDRLVELDIHFFFEKTLRNGKTPVVKIQLIHYVPPGKQT